MKIKYIISFKVLVLCILFLSTGNTLLTAQTEFARNQFTGKVTDSFGNSISGVEVRFLASDNATITDAFGYFSLPIKDSNTMLEFSHTGFSTLKMSRGETKVMEIVLQKDVSYKDRIINLVYDQRPDYTVTTSVSTVSGDELCKTPYLNLAAALAGRLPGLVSQQVSAEPGSETYTLNIRGIGTSNGREPLILIDGAVGASFLNLQTINPKDVESVTIFKDGAANILYGMQGGNGIISVITKRGNYGNPRISVNADHSFQQPLRTPVMIHSLEYANLRNEAYKNDGYGDNYQFSKAQLEGYYNKENTDLYPDNNWYKTFMKPMVKTQRYNVSVSGGGESLKYYNNLSYTHVDGPFEVKQTAYNPTQSTDRFQFRTNVDLKLNNYIGAFANISGLVQRANGSIYDDNTILNSIFNLPPTMYGPLTPDGQVIAIPQNSNPTYGLINQSGYSKKTSTKMNANLGLNLDLSFLTKGLSARAAAIFDVSGISQINASSDFERWMRETGYPDWLVFVQQGSQQNTALTLNKYVWYNYMSDFNWNLKYSKTMGLHSLGAMGFTRYQYENRASLDMTGILPYKRLTYGGRLNYAFDNVFFAEVAASYEGSEQFAPERRFGIFPAGSMAWVISNQKFLKGNKTITNLKIRASNAIVGNDQLLNSRYPYLDNIRQIGGAFIGNRGAYVDEMQQGNPLLTWEKANKSNIGIELGLWNQFTLTADIYSENRNDILLQRNSVPASQGLPTGVLAPFNMGETLNQGFEMQLGYSKGFNKNFSLSVQTYMAFNKNSVLKSDEIQLGEEYVYRYRITGYSIGQNWGYLIDKSNGNGYFNSQEEITQSGLTYEGRAPRPGDFIYKDLNADKIINEKDVAPVGSPSFPRISWGANINLKWKNFDASILLQGIGEHSKYYSGMGFFDFTNNGTYFDMNRNAWSPERYASGANITAPALSTSQSSSNRVNDFYVLNMQYARLKNLEVGYLFPTSLVKKILAESIRIYASGHNLLTIDKLNNKDLDPEMESLTSFPTNRTWNIGLNVTF